MIVAVVNSKGGVGKSSLAVNLAAARACGGRDVVLVDTDPQGSAMKWSGERDASGMTPRVPVIAKSGKGLQAEIADLARRYQDIVIDTGARDSPEARASLVSANVVVVPAQASQADLWNMESLIELIEAARGFNPNLRVIAVVTRASTNPAVQETAAAREFIAAIPAFAQSSSVIRDRAVWRRSFASGLSISENRPVDARANAEFDELAQEVFDG